MNKGTIIKCEDANNLKETLKELGDAGYGAVRVSPYGSYTIMITSVPGREEK